MKILYRNKKICSKFNVKLQKFYTELLVTKH